MPVLGAAQLSHRYIADRFLPDKAIDLIDEAASRLRIEIDSSPEEIDELERRARQLDRSISGSVRTRRSRVASAAMSLVAADTRTNTTRSRSPCSARAR